MLRSSSELSGVPLTAERAVPYAEIFSSARIGSEVFASVFIVVHLFPGLSTPTRSSGCWSFALYSPSPSITSDRKSALAFDQLNLEGACRTVCSLQCDGPSRRNLPDLG